MTRSHGPDFRKQVIDLVRCPTCRGRAVTKGLFFEMACTACNASGWVSAETGEALPLEELVTQLSIRLQAAEHQIAKFNCFKPAGAEAQYNDNNRRGAGGTNYTGD
ncbi:hypothetical protein [Pseudomonas asplenii]|uniref:Prophage PssSM-03 n=1 Tax=Pseudomonas asplenii TaxID=53407 RepID=A0A1H6P0Q4_9PSED|nr:hypothetical protein [Pseudomonas fuscovaginae]SEI17145.1 hypothetical protein SAMN05216581_3315 [Pseudomonas fuscovaginae]